MCAYMYVCVVSVCVSYRLRNKIKEKKNQQQLQHNNKDNNNNNICSSSNNNDIEDNIRI